MKNIDSDLIRGNIDTIILTTMLDGDKYGLDIIKDVETRSNGTYELKQPTLYSCLKRLENQELISSYWLDSDIGGRRHYYKLTEKGRDSLLKKQEEWAKSKFIIDNLLSNHDYDEYRLVKKEDYDKIIEGKKFEYTPSASENIDNQNQQDDVLEEMENHFESNQTEDHNLNSDNFDDLVDLDDLKEYESLINDEDDVNDEIDDQNKIENINTKHVNYNDESEDIENDYPNQKRFKIPSIYDSINIDDVDSNDSITDDKLNEDTDDEIVNSIYSNAEDSDLPNENNVYDDTDEFEEIEYGQENENVIDGENNVVNLDEDEFIFGNDNSDDEDDRVYLTPSNSYEEDDDNDLNIQANPISDQSKNELNILSKLRMYDDEVNEYIGDKNSYVNHLNKTSDIEKLKSDNLNVVQEDLLSSDNYLSQSSIDNKINEFSSAIEELNKFSNQSNEDDYSSNIYDSNQSTNFDELSDLNYDSETEIEEELISNNNEHQNSEDIIEFKQVADFKDDYLDELEELKTLNNHGFFNSHDTVDYDSDFSESINNHQQKNSFDNLNNLSEIHSDPAFEKQIQEYNSQFGYDQPEHHNDNFINSYDANEIYNDNIESTSDFSTFDEIISKNVDSYSNDVKSIPDNASSFSTFVPKYTENSYKEKLNNLSLYSKVNQEETHSEKSEPNEDVMAKIKDIQALKTEFADEGICVKEFKRSNGQIDVDRNYLLINKMNLIKSLILLFGYVFVLSAVYIIMNNTSAQTIHNFSFKYFLIGFIPFAIYALYHTVMFVINPYKKIPAKFAPRIMIFIAIIITIQLLLITYCVNLQMGFYSFSQDLYNHLLWVIPTIISFAPIITTLIHIALYYSKNFNV